MQRILFAALLFSFSNLLVSQNIFHALILDEQNKEPLVGATLEVDGLPLGVVTDSLGRATLEGIPDGEHELVIRFLGYQTKERDFDFPLKNPAQVFGFELEPSSENLDNILVSTGRTSRSIRELPTRIEVISSEELDEKADIHPGDIKVLLNESTGIATQTTSAASGIANIRIQGLDGRYTQFLKDGMPVYQGLSTGLSAVQVSPLDLQQVEFIKGSASTLYGGGAIAGIVNLITKTPGEHRELDFLLNATSAKGLDASAFWSQKWKQLGTTLFASYNFNQPYAPSGAEFTAVPRIRRV